MWPIRIVVALVLVGAVVRFGGRAPPRFGGCRVVQNRKNNKKARSVLMRVGWDPEGLLSAPQGGHISRRQIYHARQEDEKLDAELKERAEKERLELEAEREARVLPAEGEFMKLMDFNLKWPHLARYGFILKQNEVI